jgi:hypothetical protein
MGETLNQRRRVYDEGALPCKVLSEGKKSLVAGPGTVPSEEGPANYVPAAAVIRRVQALSGITGYKGCVGGPLRQGLNIRLNPENALETGGLECERGW